MTWRAVSGSIDVVPEQTLIADLEDEFELDLAEPDDVSADLAFDPYRWASTAAPSRPTPPSLDDLVGVPLS